MTVLPIKRRRELVDALDNAKAGGLNQWQTEALHNAMARSDGADVERAVRSALIADRFTLSGLLESLRSAGVAGADKDKPYHPPTCSGGCEGGGWVPGPTAQLRQEAAGEIVRLSRCPAGPEMSQAIWEGIKGQHDAWTQGEPIDMAALVTEAKITHNLTDRTNTG